MHNHQPSSISYVCDMQLTAKDLPFPSLDTISTSSPALMESSFDWALLKSYNTLAIGFFGAGGLTGGGGGGARMEPDEAVRV